MSSASPQVREEFFNLFEGMIAKLYARGQDPNDKYVPANFAWKSPVEIPGMPTHSNHYQS